MTGSKMSIQGLLFCHLYWQEVSHCRISKQTSAPYVDGVHGDASIANLWVSKFIDLLTSPDPQAHSQLDDILSKLKLPEEN